MSCPRIISVEGNIGAGKTTILETLEAMGFLVFYENLEAWEPFLRGYYSDPKRWSFTLQCAILVDMAEQRKAAIRAAKDPANGGPEKHPFVVFERSPASSMLFAKLSAENGNMNETEFNTYLRLYDEIAWRADISVYIDTPPNTCFARIHQRNRRGEASITKEYLEAVESMHLTMLAPDATLFGTNTAVDTAAQIVMLGTANLPHRLHPEPHKRA